MPYKGQGWYTYGSLINWIELGEERAEQLARYRALEDQTNYPLAA